MESESEEKSIQAYLETLLSESISLSLSMRYADLTLMDLIFDIESGFGEEDDRSLVQSIRGIPTVLAAEYSDSARCPPLRKFVDAGAKMGNTSSPMYIGHLIRGMRGADALPGTFLGALTYFSGGLFSKPQKSVIDPGIPTVEEALFQGSFPAGNPGGERQKRTAPPLYPFNAGCRSSV